MSTDLSHTTPSNINGWYLTHDGTITGRILRARIIEDYWSPIRTNAFEVVEGAEHQQYDIGGASGKANQPVTVEAEGMWDVLWAALFTQRNTAGAFYPATFNLKATDASGNERQLTFTKLRWLDLTHDSAPNASRGFAARIYRTVKAALYSEA